MYMIDEMEAFLPLSGQKLAFVSARSPDLSVSIISFPAAGELEVCVEEPECAA